MDLFSTIALDPLGNITLALQVAIIFLLILGLPSIRRTNGKKNFLWHGYLTIVALVLHTILIVLVMIPKFFSGFGGIGALSFLGSFDVWSHAILGTAAETLGILIVAVWLSKPPTAMVCLKMKKWMVPIFIVWLISLVNGALIHLLGLL
jgi:hypothetical protein